MIDNSAPSDPEAFVSYPVRDFSTLRELNHISDPVIEAHLALYGGSAREVQLLGQHLKQARPGTAEWSELYRRLGSELNGLRLHELYFENLTPGPSRLTPALEDTLQDTWGTFKHWRDEFETTGHVRGVGWVILYRDPVDGRLFNNWINLHEEGHPAELAPLLVMDVWDHAFAGMDRFSYIQAFFMNINWERVSTRWAGASRD